MRHVLQKLRILLLAAGLAGLMLGGAGAPAAASPGICVGPVCGDGFARSSTYPWLLRLRVVDQQGRHERLAIDCRSGVLTPLDGPVERGYARAVAQRACRFNLEEPA
jgi:hypothetical protein